MVKFEYIRNFFYFATTALLSFIDFVFPVGAISSISSETKEKAQGYFEQYCFDCHDSETKKGDIDLTQMLTSNGTYDLELVFENLITAKMPPANKKKPNEKQRSVMLNLLAKRQESTSPEKFRRITRHEFVHSVNDLLRIKLNLTGDIPEDRGTHIFDSNRKVQFTSEMLKAYFKATDDMLEFALPAKGFEPERIWVTNKIKDSHESYNIYNRPYEDGILFSWTRANNGNSYSFFYDHFEPPVSGWYDLTFDAKKIGSFPEDISLLVFAGKYFYADDRPQPQRLLDVISLDNRQIEAYTIRVFLHPGENVSVHCHSKHNFRQRNGDIGAYIKQLKVRGPILEQWPPLSYLDLFSDFSLKVLPREAKSSEVKKSKLHAIGGSLTVSSSQMGMEKGNMQDGSNQTFWHTRFKPSLAKPPHFVVIKNPKANTINGLSYATWSGGNGNGQIEAYSIYFSDDGKSWSERVMAGKLEIRLANEQSILFPKPTKKRFIKFLVNDAFTLDGRSLASIGKLDVITELPVPNNKLLVTVMAKSEDELKQVIRSFAQLAFATHLTDAELEPYFAVSLLALKEQGEFMSAAKVGLKAVLCSQRFLLAPGEHANKSYEKAADLSRIVWLSVPDEELLQLAQDDRLSDKILADQIDRLLQDPRSSRMINSFCDQWLNLRSFNKITPSLKLYPLYDEQLNRYLRLETEEYLKHLVQENLSVSHLIDSNFSFLNQRLAQHYNIEGVFGQQLRKVSFGPEVPRGGLLTMGSVLKVTADGFDTSPILRGAWISKNIVGNTLSPPPESVNAVEPEHGSDAITLRDQIEKHKNKTTCFGCHKSIDPYGFALENFDATGQWRNHYRIKLPHHGTFQYRPKGYFKLAGKVDAAGEVAQKKFENIFGFKKILFSDHRKVAYNFIKKFFEYANGYKPSLDQRLRLYSMISSQAEVSRMKDLIRQVLVYSMEQGRE